jgi:hypothetical protein
MGNPGVDHKRDPPLSHFDKKWNLRKRRKLDHLLDIQQITSDGVSNLQL